MMPFHQVFLEVMSKYTHQLSGDEYWEQWILSPRGGGHYWM